MKTQQTASHWNTWNINVRKNTSKCFCTKFISFGISWTKMWDIWKLKIKVQFLEYGGSKSNVKNNLQHTTQILEECVWFIEIYRYKYISDHCTAVNSVHVYWVFILCHKTLWCLSPNFFFLMSPFSKFQKEWKQDIKTVDIHFFLRT
jgi:hypothetical protein